MNQTSFEVKGKVTPANADVSVNGASTSTDSDGSFSGIVYIDPGKNKIKVTAVNGSKDTEYSQVVTRKAFPEQAATQKSAEEAAKEQQAVEQPNEPDQQQQQQPAQEQQAAAPVKSHPQFGDGTYQVGTDIQPGTYRTREGSPNCYYERLRNFTGSLNSIIANGNTNAPAVVTIKPTDAGFNSQGCGTWTKDLSAITTSKTSFGEGAYIVGRDIVPGTYRSSGGNNCYYERLRDFTGGLNSIIANGNTNAPTIVTIQPTDAGFQSQDCGSWTMLQ
jgi:hypothetical protein